MSDHRSQLTLPKTGFLDLIVCLALNNQKLADWVRTEIAAGIAEPPRICIRPAMGDAPIEFTVNLPDELVQGAWGIAKALEADTGERVTAGDVFAVLLTRAARRDTIQLRANRGDDFDFIAWQFAALRSPGDEPQDEAVRNRVNTIIQGVALDFDLVPRPTYRQLNEAAQRRQEHARAAEQQRLQEARQAEHVRQAEERNRLAKLLVV